MGVIISPTTGAALAMRQALAGTAIVPAGAVIAGLTEVQARMAVWDWFGRLDRHQSHADAVRAGKTVEGTIIATNRRALDMRVHTATNLPELAKLDFEWSKPIGDWKKDDITGLILAAFAPHGNR